MNILANPERITGRIVNFLAVSPELRRLIYTTNPLDSFNRAVRKFTKTKGIFPHENSLLKAVFWQY